MKKGFTLVEMLAVIIILGILVGIIAPAVVNTINESKQKAYNTTIESVKSAAKSYMEFSFDSFKEEIEGYGYIEISVSELIEEGFLPEGIKNPKDSEPLGGSVRINKYSENRYEYDYLE